MKPTQKLQTSLKIAAFVFIVSISTGINAQVNQRYSITGQLADKNSSQPLPFATVALKRTADSSLVAGVSSDAEGKFRLGSFEKGKYELVISAIGYETSFKNIDLSDDVETGTILLSEKSLSLPEIVVSSERRKAVNGADKTVWLINQGISDASSSGTDLLGHIPGINVDMMKNISLAGSRNIIILVDGREREKNFVSQLDASRIDKVEVIDNPGPGYDAGITGVINIILKKDRKSGIGGYISAELPSSESEIYLSPAYSLNYGTGKLNLYTSYNGDFAYFDIIESTMRTFTANEKTTNVFSEQVVRQKNWSHRFHYGFDYLMNEKNQFNFYAWYNPWSREFDGSIQQTIETDGFETGSLSGTKNDTDVNSSSFYSAYFRHNFASPGTKIEVDLSDYSFIGNSFTDFAIVQVNGDVRRSAGVMPSQNTVIMKVDFSTVLSDKLTVDAGLKSRFQSMQDRQSDNFNYNENVHAAYGAVTYQISKYTVRAGLRAEKSSADLPGSFDRKYFSLLPGTTLNYRISNKQDMNLNYSRTVNRPGLNELNPNTVFSDLYSAKSGNPFLKPGFYQNLSFRYSVSSGKNYYSFQLYSRKRKDAINNYTLIEDGIFRTGVENLGDIRAYGLEMTGSMKLFKILSLNTYFNLYDLRTSVNSIARQYGIGNRRKASFESGISAIATFRHDIAASLRFHYSTPGTDIQTTTFGDALYFISLEKSFLKNYKACISSALPFLRSFTYSGYEIKGTDFSSRSEGDIQLSRIPLFFTFRYQFNSGRKISRIDREKEEISNKPAKGF